jgi:general secretion pathway protein L
VLRFPPAAGLQRRVLLPRAAEQDLPRVLEFEMDRLTPFTADRVLYGFRRLGTVEGGRRIEIELAVVPQRAVQTALDRLQGYGLTPRRVELAGPTTDVPPLEVRGRREGTQRSTARRGLAFGLGLYALAAAAALAWLGWAYLQERAEAARLATRIEAAQASNTELGALRRELAVLAAVNQRIEQEHRQRPSAAVLLEVLSRLLPDEVWLTELDLDDRTVRIGGFAEDPAALIPLLTSSPHLTDIGFAAPSVRDPESRRVRFAIAGEVRPLRSLMTP